MMFSQLEEIARSREKPRNNVINKASKMKFIVAYLAHLGF